MGTKEFKDAVDNLSGQSIVIPVLTKVVGTATETIASDTFIEVSIANVGNSAVEFTTDNGVTTTEIDAGFEVSFRARPGDKLAEIKLTGTDPTSTYYVSSTKA